MGVSTEIGAYTVISSELHCVPELELGVGGEIAGTIGPCGSLAALSASWIERRAKADPG